MDRIWIPKYGETVKTLQQARNSKQIRALSLGKENKSTASPSIANHSPHQQACLKHANRSPREHLWQALPKFFGVHRTAQVQNHVQHFSGKARQLQGQQDWNFWPNTGSWRSWLLPLLGPIASILLLLLGGPRVFQVLVGSV